MRNISSSSTNTTTTTAQSVPDMVAAIRFHPTEDEKVDFLSKKMKSHNSQACLFLPVIDVRKFEPWELPVHMFPDSPYHAKAWYSFSWCDYKSINSRRFKRETKKGSWKMNSKQRDVGSKYFTCKKRTLTFQKKTFQEGSKSKSVPTGWKMHEYICIKPKRGSSPHQERDQQRGFVLCVLKYKPVYSKSNNKKLKGTSIRGVLADSTGNRGYIASSSGDDEAATAAAMNQDDGEPGGGSSSSDFIKKSLCDMIEEWQSCAPLGECLNSLLPQLGDSLDIFSHELVDPGTGGCITYNSDNEAAAMNHMVPDLEELLAYKQLERAVLGSGDHNDGEPHSGISSDFNDQAVCDMVLELEKDLDSPLSSPEPPQRHQLGNFLDVHSGEFSNWPSTIGDNDSYDTNKNTVASNYDNEPVINIAHNSQNLATNERTSEPYSQPEENRGSPFQPFDQLQNYTLQSCAPVGQCLNSLFPLPESPQPPRLGNAPEFCSDKLVDPGTGGCITYNTDNQAAPMNHVISDTEEILAYKELVLAVLGNGNHDDGEPGSNISSDFIDQDLDDMILEFSAELQKDLDSPFPPPEPPQTHQPHQLGDVRDAHSSEFSNCPSSIGDNGFYLTNKNNIATNYDNEQVINIAYNSPNCATNERISEAYSQPEENRGSPFQPFDQLHNFPLQSPILFSELGELLLANTCIGRNESQSLNMEPATLFPQSS